LVNIVIKIRDRYPLGFNVFTFLYDFPLK